MDRVRKAVLTPSYRRELTVLARNLRETDQSTGPG